MKEKKKCLPCTNRDSHVHVTVMFPIWHLIIINLIINLYTFFNYAYVF